MPMSCYDQSISSTHIVSYIERALLVGITGTRYRFNEWKPLFEGLDN